MADDDLVFLAYADLSGHVRGRAIPSRRYPTTIGWVPADQSITPFGTLGENNPFGPLGDLRLLPDDGARFRVERPGHPALDFVLCDAVEPEGQPFAACPRAALRSAIERLGEHHGLVLRAAFEHEFTLLPTAGVQEVSLTREPAFGLGALRAAEPFASDVARSLAQAGLAPENILAEYGPGQFEVTISHAPALAAADRAAALREVVRDVGRLHARPLTFSPIVDPAGVGNGVHVHFSLHTPDGRAVTHERGGEAELSRPARAFCSGVMRHLPAIVALTAPAAVSYLRLTPHRWSAAWTASGVRNREATLRVCPGATPAGWNVEFRAADAAACPHLVLAALIHAGCQGLDERLDDLRLLPGDPNAMSEAELQAIGAKRLPESLPAALEAFASDSVAAGWFPSVLVETYLEMKASELAHVEGLSPEELASWYAAIY